MLQDWIGRAEASGIKVLQKLAGTPALYRTGILAHYDCRLSTGPLEGANNKVKTIRSAWPRTHLSSLILKAPRRAHDFREKGFFKLKILAVREATCGLLGCRYCCSCL